MAKYNNLSQWHAVNSLMIGSFSLYSTHSSVESIPLDWKETMKVPQLNFDMTKNTKTNNEMLFIIFPIIAVFYDRKCDQK